MKRRSLLAAVGTSTVVWTAGCLDTIGFIDAEESSVERDVTAVAIETDHEEVSANVAVESHFTDSSAGILTVELTNHEVERTIWFSGYEIPWFGVVDHAEEAAELHTMSTEHFAEAPPDEPIDGCWTYELVPPRPGVWAPKTMEPGETVVAEFALAAPMWPEDDAVPEPCLPAGTYTGESEDKYSMERYLDPSEDADGVIMTTLDVTIEAS